MYFGKLIYIAGAVFSWSITTAAAAADTKPLSSADLTGLVGKDGIVRLTDRTFDRVVEGPRDYTIAVLLTAEGPQYSCGFCKIVAPSWLKIASSWHQDHPNGDGLFFATADVADSPSTFRKLGLNQAPNLWVYPPVEKNQAVDINYDTYRFAAAQDQVTPLVEYFGQAHGKRIVIHEPFPYDKVIVGVATTAAIVVGIVAYWRVIFSALQWKPLWAAFSLLLILMFIAGYMFNTIRHPPYVAGDGNGGVVYFIAGHSQQLVIETQIMAIAYAILSFSAICLVVKIPKLKDQRSVLLLVVSLASLLFLGYSFVLSKFKIKNGGFPYSLLDIF